MADSSSRRSSEQSYKSSTSGGEENIHGEKTTKQHSRQKGYPYQKAKMTIKLGICSRERIGNRKHLTWDEFLFVNSGGSLGRFEETHDRRASGGNIPEEAPKGEARNRCKCNMI